MHYWETKGMQAWYFTEATKAIASMHPGHCLGALETLQYAGVEIYNVLIDPLYIKTHSEIAHQYGALKIFLMMTSGEMGQ